MPPTKRRRTDRGSSAGSRVDSERSGSYSPRPHKSARKRIYEDKENGDPNVDVEPPVGHADVTPHRGCSGGVSPRNSTKNKKKPYEYICFHRPLFDVDGENWRKWSEGKAERLEKHEIYTKLYKPGYIEENKKGIWAASPAEHKDHKWVMMWNAWLMFDGFCRRTKYRDPDDFNMHIYTDWKDWSMQEIVDNAMLDFDQAFRQKGGQRLEKMWSIMSAIGLWVNAEDVTELISSGDGQKDCDLVGLLGCALLTVLSAIDRSGELKLESRFLDLALVIGYFLELSHDLPAYGIESACVCWRKEAVMYFKKGNLDPKRALFDTEHRLKQLESASNVDLDSSDKKTDEEADADLLHHQHGTESDPWAWSATMEKYKKKYDNAIGLQQYEIIKFTKAQRGEAGKAPLADVPVKDPRRNLRNMR